MASFRFTRYIETELRSSYATLVAGVPQIVAIIVGRAFGRLPAGKEGRARAKS